MTEQELNSGIEQILTNLLIEARRLAGVEWECDVWALRGQIRDLIKEAGYVRLAEDQRLPENPYPLDYPDGGDCYYATEQAQQGMLTANFRKVEL